MKFSRQEFWSWLLLPFPGDLPDPGIEPGSPALQTDSLLFEPPGKPQSMNSGNSVISQKKTMLIVLDWILSNFAAHWGHPGSLKNLNDGSPPTKHQSVF